MPPDHNRVLLTGVLKRHTGQGRLSDASNTSRYPSALVSNPPPQGRRCSSTREKYCLHLHINDYRDLRRKISL
jgi:hypothetical protein